MVLKIELPVEAATKVRPTRHVWEHDIDMTSLII